MTSNRISGGDKAAQAAGLRRAAVSDAEAIIDLYRQTVRTVNRRDYTPEQVQAWAPDDIPLEKIVSRIADTYVLVTEDETGVTAIGSLTGPDYLDMLFVRHDRQGRGLGGVLMRALEAEARRLGAAVMTADVSMTAEPVFRKAGFEIVTEQDVHLRGQVLRNFKMRKQLS